MDSTSSLPAPAASTSTPKALSQTVTSNFDAKKVSMRNLPDSIRPFIASHYPGYTIAAATYDPLCGGAPAIDVAVRATGMPAYSLIFLPNGNYVQREEEVPLATVPPAVMASVKEKYSDFRIGKQAEKLVLADNSTEYSFDVAKPHNAREAVFSSSGQIVCEGKE